MAKTKDFEINSGEPAGGMTFAGNKTHVKDMDASMGQKKRDARFGIMNGEPTGTTFQANKSFVPTTNADKAPLISKAIYTSPKGTYTPPSNQITSGTSYAGRPGIGKSSPKKGKNDPIAHKFKV